MRHKVSVLAAGVVAVLACALLLYRCGTADVADDAPSTPSVSRAPGDAPRDPTPQRVRVRAVPDADAAAEPVRSDDASGAEARPVPAPAPDASATPPPASPPRAEVSGRVLRAADREPMAGAVVVLNGPSTGAYAERSSATDALGGFRFVGVPPGKFVLQASADGYAQRTSSRFEVTPDAGHAGLEILLATGGTIEGRVLDRNEAPLVGVTVRLERGNPNVRVAATKTDVDGWYRFEHVLPDRYGVEAERGADQTQSGYVQVADDEVARLDFRTDAALVGLVLDPDGDPLAGAMVNAWSAGPPLVHRQATTDDEGHCRIPGLAPGEWSLSVHVLGANGFSASAGKLTAVRGDNDVTIRVEAGEISGKVFIRSTGAPPSPRSIQLSARQLDPTAGPFGNAMTWAKPDGTFRFAGLAAGRYRLRVDTFDATLRVLELHVDLAAGEHRGGVELALETCVTGVVRIVARDAAGKPAEGLTVSVMQGETWLTGPTPSPEPGVYVLRLEAGPQTLSLSRAGFETSTVSVELEEGATTTVEVVMTQETAK